MAEPSPYHLCNTSFYYQVFRVLGGCFFDNREWIDTGLDNPEGVYARSIPHPEYPGIGGFVRSFVPTAELALTARADQLRNMGILRCCFGGKGGVSDGI